MQSKCILIVEDEPDILDMLSMNFKRRGYEVITAADGCEALAYLEHGKPQLILTDICLPGANGFEILSRVRSVKSTANSPVIMISASPDHCNQTHQFHPDLFINKPFGLTEINDAVNSLIGHA